TLTNREVNGRSVLLGGAGFGNVRDRASPIFKLSLLVLYHLGDAIPMLFGRGGALVAVLALLHLREHELPGCIDEPVKRYSSLFIKSHLGVQAVSRRGDAALELETQRLR